MRWCRPISTVPNGFRIRKRFALFPVRMTGDCEDGAHNIAWLETYYVAEEYRFGYMSGYWTRLGRYDSYEDAYKSIVCEIQNEALSSKKRQEEYDRRAAEKARAEEEALKKEERKTLAEGESDG